MNNIVDFRAVDNLKMTVILLSVFDDMLMCKHLYRIDPTLQDWPQVGWRMADRGNVRESFFMGGRMCGRRTKRDVKTSFQGRLEKQDFSQCIFIISNLNRILHKNYLFDCSVPSLIQLYHPIPFSTYPILYGLVCLFVNVLIQQIVEIVHMVDLIPSKYGVLIVQRQKQDFRMVAH